MRRLILEISEKELLKFGLEMQPLSKNKIIRLSAFPKARPWRIRSNIKDRIQGWLIQNRRSACWRFTSWSANSRTRKKQNLHRLLERWAKFILNYRFSRRRRIFVPSAWNSRRKTNDFLSWKCNTSGRIYQEDNYLRDSTQSSFVDWSKLLTRLPSQQANWKTKGGLNCSSQTWILWHPTKNKFRETC